jgi:hypothetical protein
MRELELSEPGQRTIEPPDAELPQWNAERLHVWEESPFARKTRKTQIEAIQIHLLNQLHELSFLFRRR